MRLNFPPTFRPPGGVPRKPVAGGRWQVRNVAPNTSDRKPWQAKTKGTASHLNRRFATHQEAIAWAAAVATVYAMEPGPDKDEAYYQLRVAKYGELHIVKGVFPENPTRKHRK